MIYILRRWVALGVKVLDLKESWLDEEGCLCGWRIDDGSIW
jgi:hypothetical protein